MFVLFAPARHVKCNGCEKMCKCEDNLNNHTDSEHPKKAFQSGPAAGAHIVCTIAAAMLTLFTAHKLTPQLPPLPSHRSPDTTTSHHSENNTRLSFSRMFQWPGCVIHKWEAASSKYLLLQPGIRVSVCISRRLPVAFPAGASCIFQLPTAFFLSPPPSFFLPKPPYLAPKPFY